jgi:hypothetical protein
MHSMHQSFVNFRHYRYLLIAGAAWPDRDWLDGVYKLVRNDEAYTPEKFVTALRQLQSVLDKHS